MLPTGETIRVPRESKVAELVELSLQYLVIAVTPLCLGGNGEGGYRDEGGRGSMYHA